MKIVLSEDQKSDIRSAALKVDDMINEKKESNKIVSIHMKGSSVQEFVGICQYFVDLFVGFGKGYMSNDNLFVLTIPNHPSMIITATKSLDTTTISITNINAVENNDPDRQIGFDPVNFEDGVYIPVQMFLELSLLKNNSPFHDSIHDFEDKKKKFLSKSVIISEKNYLKLVDRYLVFSRG